MIIIRGMTRNSRPGDVADEEWLFVLPYLPLMREDAPQQEHDLREIFNDLRWHMRAGSPWRYLPNDFPPWHAVYQQSQRWAAVRVFEAVAQDLPQLLRMAEGRDKDFIVTVIDSRTLQSTPESGQRAGYDGAKRKKGSKMHIAVDRLGHLLSLHVTPADRQNRQEVKQPAQAMQNIMNKSVELAYLDQGYAGSQPAEDAAKNGIKLEVVKLPKAKRGFVLLPRCWAVERAFAWRTRCRRLAKDYERLATTVKALHFAAFPCLMHTRFFANSS